MTDLPTRRTLDVSLLVTALALLAGGIIAVGGLGRDSLWLDESYTRLLVQMPWHNLLASARIDAVNPPLYYVLVKALVRSQPPSEWVLRAPSVAFQLLGIAGSAAIGSAVGGRIGRPAAAWMWALHPMAVWYAREARPYALAAALAAVTVACYLRVDRGASWRWWIVGAVSMAAGLVSHYFFFVLAASLLLLSLTSLRARPAFFRSWTLLTLATLLPLGLWLVWFFRQGEPSLGIGWIPRPAVLDSLKTLWNMFSGYGGQFDVATMIWGGLVAVLAFFGLTDSEQGAEARRYAVVGVVVPLVAVWTISQRRPVFVDRYFLILLPWVAGLVAIGAQSWMRRMTARNEVFRRGAPAIVVIVGLIVAGQVVFAPKYRKEDWRGLVQAIHSRGATASELVLSEPEISLPLTYYGGLDSIGEGGRLVPDCGAGCWWILRQPYTVTHAFTQSVTDPSRPWLPQIPEGCRQDYAWRSPTGIQAWQLTCP